MADIDCEPETAKAFASDAAVAARSIVWTRGLAEQQKADVIESTLLAQAVADKHHPAESESETVAWYKKYIDTLTHLGWIAQASDFTEVPYKAEGSVYDAVLDSLRQDAGLQASVTGAYEAYSRAGEKSVAAEVLHRSSVAPSSRFASFQIAIASTNGDKLALTVLACLYSSKLSEVRNALGHSGENASLSIKTSKLDMTLNMDLYSKVRPNIHEKLVNSGKLDSLVAV